MRLAALGSVALIALLTGGWVWAGSGTTESLAEAMARAYHGNPTLRAERARQRATDEQVPQALSGWRPTVTAQDELAYEVDDRDNGATSIFSSANNKSSDSIPATLSIELNQPLFRGFKTVEGTKAAKATVKAGRQNLLAVEQQVLFDTSLAYFDVIRDRRIVQLREQNVGFLRQQLEAARARFDAGEITRTDVAQSQARLSLAQGELATARGNLAASEAAYMKVVGHAPARLAYPKPAKLPKSLEAAHAIAQEQNPNILSAAFIEIAARHNIEVVKGDLLPELSLRASGTQQWDDLDDGRNVQFQNVTVAGVLTVPLYESGAVYSAVRQQKHVASQRRLQIIETGRAVREAVTQSWASYVAAGQTITAVKAQVAANVLALEGVQQEYLVGSRTLLDVLDAEFELVNSRIQLVVAERDRAVAAYQLLGSVGWLTAEHLALPVALYDPKENYKRVKNKWFGTGVEEVE
jgi:TolC family type I secretion outer membrane protein